MLKEEDKELVRRSGKSKVLLRRITFNHKLLCAYFNIKTM